MASDGQRGVLSSRDAARLAEAFELSPDQVRQDADVLADWQGDEDSLRALLQERHEWEVAMVPSRRCSGGSVASECRLLRRGQICIAPHGLGDDRTGSPLAAQIAGDGYRQFAAILLVTRLRFHGHGQVTG